MLVSSYRGGANTNDLQHMLFSILIEPEKRCRNPYKIVETCITKVKILSSIEQIRRDAIPSDDQSCELSAVY
jgi:hypothetical protein